MKQTPSHLRECRADDESVLDFPFRARGSSFSVVEVVPHPNPSVGRKPPEILNSMLSGSALLGDVKVLVSSVMCSTLLNAELKRSTVSASDVVESRALYSFCGGSVVYKSTVFESSIRASSILESEITHSTLTECGVVASSLHNCVIEHASISGARLQDVELQASLWIHGGEWMRAPIYIEGPEFVISECYGGRVHVGCWCVKPSTLYRHEGLLSKIVGEDRVVLVKALLDELVRQIKAAPPPNRKRRLNARRSNHNRAG